MKRIRNKIEKGIFSFAILLVMTFFLICMVSAAFTDSTPQISPTTFSTTSFDSTKCQQGSDFIVQISPTGCTPVVVRSDLLEEQDVQVYCPLSATQINPLININAITSISFPGNYPPNVKSIGFYPAQAALNLQGQQNNYPLLSNIGYVVINLKQTPNESAMPDFVIGNLTAKISYDSNKVFGVGNANLYLPELTDSEWDSNAPEYQFWNGKGYLRADIVGDQATIKIYDSSLTQQGTANLKVGETSNAFSISGFDFCTGGVQVKLNALKTADTRVKLDVNGDLAEVSKGENFLDNNCQLVSTEQQGLVKDAKITCGTDSGKKTFDLKIAPQITLNNVGGDGKNRNVNLGDYLYTVPGDYSVSSNLNGGKSVFLGYIGSKTATPDVKSLYIVLVALPKNALENENSLSTAELSSIASWVQNNKLDWKSGTSGVLQVLIDAGKLFTGATESFLRLIISGQSYVVLDSGTVHIIGEDNFRKTANDIKVIGFAEGQDVTLNSQTKQYYQNAADSYNEVQTNYQSETYPPQSTATLGEQALYNQLVLANQLQQKFTLPALCDNFRQKYPKSKMDMTICDDKSLLSSTSASSQYISVNGHSYLISLKSIYQPTYEDYGAQIQVKYKDGSTKGFPMNKGQSQIINDTSKDFMQLGELTLTTAKVSGNIKAFSSNTVTLKLNEPAVFDDYVLTLQHVNLKQFAQVSVIPKSNSAGSEANFSFKIGIEKRAVQLSPDKIREKLDATKKSIATFETISNATGKIVQGLTAACEATGAILTVKNFFNNLGGDAGARQAVMQGIWDSKCADEVSSGASVSLDQCFLKNSATIDKDVSAMADFRTKQNDNIKKLEEPVTTGSFLGESVVNTNNFMQTYSPEVQSSLNNIDSVVNPNDASKSISATEAKNLLAYTNWKDNNFNTADARNVELYATILGSSSASETLKTLARSGLYSTLADIKVNSEKEILQNNFGQETGLGSDNVMVGSFQKQNEISITQPKIFSSSQYYSANPNLNNFGSDYTFGFKDSVSGNSFIIIYGKDGIIKDTYTIGANNKLTAYVNDKSVVVLNPFNIKFNQYDEGTYKNVYKNPQVQYFETDPYKGMPAIVPFDLDNGWYAAMKQTLAVGNNIQTYDASAKVNSFYLCNVGKNGIQEFNSGIGDDTCQSMNIGTDQLYNQFTGLKEDSSALVVKAKNAIQQAAKAYQSGVSKVTINGKNIPVGTPATDIPSIQCQDFMSPSDCNLLFNLCDPVICPSSRCDFGGAYHVQDVAQTGIIGSTLLCLPNAREGIVIPVCLTGIQSGLENFISVQKAYSDCLQESLSTGKTTGICDEVNSIYMCDFFWQQAAPLASLAVPKITEYLSGQSTRGGGEYMSVQNAFDTAKKSVDYMTNYYGAGSAAAFKIKSLNVGTVFCQNFASLTVPNGADILNQITTPDSPPQYTGNFEEISLTTVTVPPTSQYKVFYHIYAGKNAGVYYSVYLQRSSGSSFYQDSSSVLPISSGYIDAGGYADQTIDKSASSGYNQLCINVNGKVECGFQQVSTSLAVNYIQDQAVANEINQNVTTESDCISGAPNILSVLNPNVQSGVSNVIDPQLYNQGITRTCATGNPGIGTDSYAGQENSRWVEVGYCGDKKLKCWLDTKNIKDILNSPDLAAYLSNGTTTTLANTTLNNVRDNYLSILLGTGYLDEDKFTSAIKEILSKSNPNDRLSLISNITDKIFYNNEKAYLLLLKGDAYKELATQSIAASPQGTSGGTTAGAGTGTSTNPTAPIITQTPTQASGLQTQQISSYETYKSLFDKYARQNLPSITTLNDFEAMLVAIADQNNWGANTRGGSNWLMGYKAGDPSSQSPETQISDVSKILQSAYNGGATALSDQAGDLVSYTVCDSMEWSNQIKCILSIYHTGNGENALIAGSPNLEGSDYARQVLDYYDKWFVYFTKTMSPTVSSSAGLQITSDDILNAMNYAKTTKVVNRNCNCGTNCQQYSNSIISAANANGEDPLLLLSIMMQESECMQTNSNGKIVQNGNSYGLMQIDASTVSDCSAIGSANDINSNTDNENIQCGALILKNKYNTYGSKQNTFNCVTPSKTYTSWDAALRGYNGYGCIGDNNYVEEVNSRYTALKNVITSSPSPSVTTGIQTALPLSGYETYKSVFDKYSQRNLPNFAIGTNSGGSVDFSQNDFKALLVAIAQSANFGGSTGDWLMAYQYGNDNYKSPDSQISAVSGIFGSVLNEQVESSSAYYTCISTLVLSERLHCILSVFHTGKSDSGGLLGLNIGFLGANTEGNSYADSVMDIWSNWKKYFSQNPTA